MKNKITKLRFKLFTVLSVLLLAFTACETEVQNDIRLAGPLTASANKTDIMLNQKNIKDEVLKIEWTTGSNNGTGASISYQLEIDLMSNNFSKSLILEIGKGVYSKSFTVGELNDLLVNKWSCTPENSAVLQARVISTIYSDPTSQEISQTVTIAVTPYNAVSQTLYLYGTASPKGENLNNALSLTPQSNPTVFVYQGQLNKGQLKFITNLGSELPSYNMGSDASTIVLRTNDSESNKMFDIESDDVYKITVSLLDLTVSIEKINYPPYDAIYMVGSAAPNGWDISKATPLVQNNDNPFIFTYQGVMQAGEFKFPVNTNSDWGQDMYMMVDNTQMYLHHGGDSDDNKWTIAKKGYYNITLNLQDNSIQIYREKLYLIGSACPAGWNIGQAIEMTEDGVDGCIFTWTGAMVAGEFKFPVNRNSDWGQDMYERVDDTHIYRHIGGESDDNKWNINAAGDYTISVNIEDLTLSFSKL